MVGTVGGVEVGAVGVRVAAGVGLVVRVRAKVAVVF